MRSILAFLFAPMPAAIVLPFISPSRMLWEQPATVLLTAYALLLVLQFVLGFPLRLVLARDEQASFKVHALIGTVMYAIPVTAVAIWAASQSGSRGLRLVEGPLAFAAAGAVTGALYWLFAGIGTPAQRQRRRIAELDAQFD
jgi:hypothetical protein